MGIHRPRLTRRAREMQDRLFAEHVPVRDYENISVGWALACILWDCTATGGEEARAAEELVKFHAAKGIGDEALAWNKARSGRARVTLVTPAGVAGEPVRRRKTSMPVLRSGPKLENGKPDGPRQMYFLVEVERPIFDAMLSVVLATANAADARRKSWIKYQAQWDKHPQARSLREACELDGIDPLDFVDPADIAGT